MKYFAYLTIMVLLISVLALFYLQRPDGQSWLTTNKITNKSSEIKQQLVSLSSDAFDNALTLVKNASNKVVENVSVSTTGTATTIIYKWQDETGQWHYSDQPNPDGASQKMALDPNDITVVSAEDTSILKGSAKSGGISPSQSNVSVYDPLVIKKLFDDAEQVKTRLEQRTQQLEQTQ